MLLVGYCFRWCCRVVFCFYFSVSQKYFYTLLHFYLFNISGYCISQNMLKCFILLVVKFSILNLWSSKILVYSIEHMKILFA